MALTPDEMTREIARLAEKHSYGRTDFMDYACRQISLNEQWFDDGNHRSYLDRRKAADSEITGADISCIERNIACDAELDDTVMILKVIYQECIEYWIESHINRGGIFYVKQYLPGDFETNDY